jgi:hypothetical protein
MTTTTTITVSWLEEPKIENEVEKIENDRELAIAEQIVAEIFSIFGLEITEEEKD